MSDINRLDMNSIITRKYITNDYEIVVEVKESSLWVVWVLNSHEALICTPYLEQAVCRFSSIPSDSKNWEHHTHRYIVAHNKTELEQAVEVALEWIEGMHLAKCTAQAVVETVFPDNESE